MAEATILIEDQSDALLEKITALSKGFLLVINESDEKVCSFCKGLLILMNQYRERSMKNT
jgi:hypothetical protein